MSTQYDRELDVARAASRAAGVVMMRHYGPHVPYESKGDGSPVSRADIEADEVIVAALRTAFPDDAIVSEEGPADDGTRLQKSRVWIVDPLDGTREFLDHTGEFCVHIGLAVDGEAIVGVVHRPTEDVTYYAATGRGAFLSRPGGTIERLRVSSQVQLGAFRVGVSRTSSPPALDTRLEAAGMRLYPQGASVKYMGVAAGQLDAMVTATGREKEWDTCAPEVILREAGGTITDGSGQPLRYNQADLRGGRGIVVSNGRRHDELLALVRPIMPLVQR